MAKPQQILQLEKTIGWKIEETSLDEINITQRSYILNQQGQIIGLSLYNCELSDIAFLSNYQDLKVLCLYKNKITDISPLKKTTNLTRLYLNSNQIIA